MARLLKDLVATPSEKGFSTERLTALRAAVRPAYRRPLRWGMKNPHSTYILGLLLRYFPCLACVHRLGLVKVRGGGRGGQEREHGQSWGSQAGPSWGQPSLPATPIRYVHTVRNLPDMVRNMDHVVARIDEAATYGYLTATMASRLGVSLDASHRLASQPTRAKDTPERSVGSRQVWLAGYLIRLNGGLVAWGRHCLPANQLTYLGTIKLARCPSDDCAAVVAHDLSHTLRCGVS